MGNKEMVDAMISMFERINTDFYPFSIIIPAIFAVFLTSTIIWSFLRPGLKISSVLKTGLGIIYVYAGSTIIAGIPELGIGGIGGAVMMWIIAGFIFASLKSKDFIFSFPKEWDLRILSVYFILHGLFFYPIIELILGYRWPGLIFIGQECPTTILLIGLLIGSIKKTNRILMLILSLFAFIWGGYVSISGAAFDWLYSLAGLTGFIMTTKYWKKR